MDATEHRIIAAHSRHLALRRERDALIRTALENGKTAYSLSKAMRAALGDEGLAQNSIRKIAKVSNGLVSRR